jgi:hypothetical protein
MLAMCLRCRSVLRFDPADNAAGAAWRALESHEVEALPVRDRVLVEAMIVALRGARA